MYQCAVKQDSHWSISLPDCAQAGKKAHISPAARIGWNQQEAGSVMY